MKKVLLTSGEDTVKVKVLNNLSVKNRMIGNYDSALKYSALTKQLAEKLGFKKGIASAYMNAGNTYVNQGNYPEALQSYFSALKIRELLRDKLGIASLYGNIGLVYFYQQNYQDAMKNHLASLKIKKELNDKPGMSASYNNIGLVYFNLAEYPDALKNFFVALQIKKQLNDKPGLGTTYNGIANVYYKLMNYQEALSYHFLSLKIKEEIGDKAGIATSYLNIGACYNKLKKYPQAEENCNKSLRLAKQIGILDVMEHAHEILSGVYSGTGQHNKALSNYKEFIAIKDSLLNEENTKKTVRLEMQFEFDKKESAAKLEQEKKEAVAAAESKKQNIIIWSVCGILILVIGFAVFAYRSFLQKQKANVEITRQKEIIEEKQKEILDSIHYAKRIQTALLPNEKYLDRNLNKLHRSN